MPAGSVKEAPEVLALSLSFARSVSIAAEP